MNKIVGKEYVSEKVVKYEIEAPLIAKSRKAGHFVIVRIGEKGERIPYTIVSSDPQKEQYAGRTKTWENRRKILRTKCCDYNRFGKFTGKHAHHNFGTVLCAGGG